jgi:hypothetical protein
MFNPQEIPGIGKWDYTSPDGITGSLLILGRNDG